MKKVFFFTVMIAGFLFPNAQAHAARALDLSGNEYNVYFLCGDDVGDYCEQGKIQTDTFIFASDSDNFGIKSFGDNLLDFLGDNTYNASGLTFDAQYEAAHGLTTYEFDIKGLNIVDIIIFGTMDITYTEIGFPHNDTTDGKAFFIGIKN